jgi:CheY-like chemotaxis protein
MAGQILIVDDDQTQSKLAGVLLQEAGWVIRVAGSAEQAREVLQSFQPQLILMDIQLPGLDGLQFTRLLRLDPAYDGTKILALTAYTHATDLDQARLAGCDGYISKPIDARNFAEVVRHFSCGMHPSGASDSRDLLAEVRNSFFAEGLDRCATILKELRSGGGVAAEVVRRITHRWTDLGGMLGFPDIADCAQRIEELLRRPEGPDDAMERAFEVAYHRFRAAAYARPELPRELAAGLRGARVALAGFSNEEVDRIRNLAPAAEMQIVVEPVASKWTNMQDEYDALVVNACAPSAPSALRPEKVRIPAVFVGSISLLPSLAMLPAGTCDFVLAPWDAKEVLVRLFRLIVKPAPARAPAALPRSAERRYRVLIADDDPDIQALVSHALEEAKMESTAAADGRQALDAVRQFSPHAIVLDVDMPDLDGFEVLRRLRRNSVTANIPVLLLTSYRDESDINRGREYGADDYVTKPFLPADVANRVLKMISAAPRGPTRRLSFRSPG